MYLRGSERARFIYSSGYHAIHHIIITPHLIDTAWLSTALTYTVNLRHKPIHFFIQCSFQRHVMLKVGVVLRNRLVYFTLHILCWGGEGRRGEERDESSHEHTVLAMVLLWEWTNFNCLKAAFCASCGT